MHSQFLFFGPALLIRLNWIVSNWRLTCAIIEKARTFCRIFSFCIPNLVFSGLYFLLCINFKEVHSFSWFKQELIRYMRSLPFWEWSKILVILITMLYFFRQQMNNKKHVYNVLSKKLTPFTSILWFREEFLWITRLHFRLMGK